MRVVARTSVMRCYDETEVNRSPLTIGSLLFCAFGLAACAGGGARAGAPRAAAPPTPYESMIVVHGMLSRTLVPSRPEDDIARIDDELRDAMDDDEEKARFASASVRAKSISPASFEEPPAVTWGTPALYGRDEPLEDGPPFD